MTPERFNPRHEIKKTSKTMMARIILVGMSIMLTTPYSFAQGGDKSPLPSTKAALSVSVAPPRFEEVEKEIKASGEVVAWQESSIGSELTGLRIESIHVDVGQRVKKGQLLAKLNDNTIVADYNQAKSSLLEAQANLAQARENADRARSISKTEAISSQQVSQYLTDEAIAKARVEASKASMQIYKTRLAQTRIVAPDDGVISERTATLGSIATQEPLFKLIIKEKLQWKANVAASKINLLKKGQPVTMNLNNGETIKAHVSEISPHVDAKTRQASILVNLDKQTHANKVKPGMFVEGVLVFDNQRSMLVDQKSVVIKDGASYVFVVVGNKASQRKVTIGQRMGESIEIISGINKNESIVASGAGFVNNGDIVNIVQ